MKPVRTFLVLGMGLILIWGSAVVAETPDSAQANANMVRATYAKFVFATQLWALREAYTSGGNLGRLRVSLSTIKAGPLSEISSEIFADLAAKPSGRTLSTTPATWTYKSSEGQQYRAEGATAVWRDSVYLSEDWNMPIGQLIANGTLDPGYTDYASFTVNLSYLGEQREYPALFLFGKDATGREIILPIDHIIGISALMTLIQAPSTPDPLLADWFRNRPATRAFLQTLQVPDTCTVESRTQMCCDEASGKCGVAATTLRQHGFTVSQSMSFPDIGKAGPDCEANCDVFNTSGAPDKLTNTNTNQHYGTGAHTGSATLYPYCTYSGTTTPCVGLCHISVVTPKSSDSGSVNTAPYCHATNSNMNGTDSESPSTGCNASFGYGVVNCALCTCGVTVSVGLPGPGGGSVGVSVSGGAAVYSWGWGLAYGPCADKD